MFNAIKKNFSTILNSYAELFFIKNTLVGALIFLITLLNLNCAISGLIALLSALAFAYFIGFNKHFLKSGFYTYNPLLVGFSMGFIFKLSWLSLILIMIAGILAFVITITLSQIFHQYLGLQILSLPFVVVSSILYLALSQFSNLYVNNLQQAHLLSEPSNWPLWLTGFCKAMGAIIFMPSTYAGLLIFFTLCLCSRIMPI
eukprot:COSAG01_NODE_12419_length_1743_cov_1.565085_1_plen_200_part_10